MKERTIRELFSKKCREWGYFYIPMTGVAYAGIPDVYIVDLNLFVEFKRPDGKGHTRLNQIHSIRKIKKHGGNAIVIATPEELESLCPCANVAAKIKQISLKRPLARRGGLKANSQGSYTDTTPKEKIMGGGWAA